MEEVIRGHGPSARDLRARTGPEDVEAWTQLATALMKNQRYSEAIEVLHVAIRCEPADGRAWLTLGQAYYKAGRLDEARAALSISQRNHGPASRIEHCLERIAHAERVRSSHRGQADNPLVSLDEDD